MEESIERGRGDDRENGEPGKDEEYIERIAIEMGVERDMDDNRENGEPGNYEESVGEEPVKGTVERDGDDNREDGEPEKNEGTNRKVGIEKGDERDKDDNRENGEPGKVGDPIGKDGGVERDISDTRENENGESDTGFDEKDEHWLIDLIDLPDLPEWEMKITRNTEEYTSIMGIYRKSGGFLRPSKFWLKRELDDMMGTTKSGKMMDVSNDNEENEDLDGVLMVEVGLGLGGEVSGLGGHPVTRVPGGTKLAPEGHLNTNPKHDNKI